MMGIGATGVILLVLLGLLLFGPNKLPELGRAFGKTLREFKAGANGIMDDNNNDRRESDNGRIEVSKSGNSEGEKKRLPD